MPMCGKSPWIAAKFKPKTLFAPKGTATIRVMPALAVTLAGPGDAVLESEVGSRLDVPVSFYADVAKGTPFTKCNHLPYT